MSPQGLLELLDEFLHVRDHQHLRAGLRFEVTADNLAADHRLAEAGGEYE
jgi:hypothetical protein